MGVCHLIRCRHLVGIQTRRRGDKDPLNIIRAQVYGRILALGILVRELLDRAIAVRREADFYSSFAGDEYRLPVGLMGPRLSYPPRGPTSLPPPGEPSKKPSAGRGSRAREPARITV